MDDEQEPSVRSRPGSRRNSSSHSRRNSVKKDKDKKKSPLNTAPNSNNSTPKRVAKPEKLEFIVTGKQLLKKSDRANSLPGFNRRQSTDSVKSKKIFETGKKSANVSHSSKSQETSLEDDMSLDLSQVSDFEDNNSKYGIREKRAPLATSTPKNLPKNFVKPRSGSLQSQIYNQKLESSRTQKSFDSKQSRDCSSRDSMYKTSSTASPYRYGLSTELDYSSVSPEYSGQSSADLSPRRQLDRSVSPRSQELHESSCCVSSWQDCSDVDNTKVEYRGENGEWNNFWANYNNSIAKVPMKSYYDQCPTPYRTENIDLADLEFSDTSRKRSPDDIRNINQIIRNEGLHLTPRETQNIIKCAHILGNVLTKAIERRSKEKEVSIDKIQEINTEKELKEIKKTMKLNLKETYIPVDGKEEKKCEAVTTQTDISLPNTKSAPRIFENILRQLSMSTVDDGMENNAENNKIDAKEDN